MHADGRRLLQRRAVELGDLVDLVGDDADRGGSPSRSISITTKRESGVIGAGGMPNRSRRSASGMTLPRTLIRLRDIGLGPRHARHRDGVENFAHLARVEASTSPARPSISTCALVFRVVGRHAASGLPELSRASRICPAAIRCGTSRISATAPSPRMVAPEKLGASACSLESDLITVWWLPMIWSTTRPTRSSRVRDDDHLLVRIAVAGLARTIRAGAGTARGRREC